MKPMYRSRVTVCLCSNLQIFVNYFSDSLRLEYGSKDIIIQVPFCNTSFESVIVSFSYPQSSWQFYHTHTHTHTSTSTQTVMPNLVATAMSNVRRVTSFRPSPETYARTAVATIGIQNTTYGYWQHALQVSIVWEGV